LELAIPTEFSILNFILIFFKMLVRVGKIIEGMVYGDGPVVSPGFTQAMWGLTNEIKNKVRSNPDNLCGTDLTLCTTPLSLPTYSATFAIWRVALATKERRSF
jgi:hypothetical protein